MPRDLVPAVATAFAELYRCASLHARQCHPERFPAARRHTWRRCHAMRRSSSHTRLPRRHSRCTARPPTSTHASPSGSLPHCATLHSTVLRAAGSMWSATLRSSVQYRRGSSRPRRAPLPRRRSQSRRCCVQAAYTEAATTPLELVVRRGRCVLSLLVAALPQHRQHTPDDGCWRRWLHPCGTSASRRRGSRPSTIVLPMLQASYRCAIMPRTSHRAGAVSKSYDARAVVLGSEVAPSRHARCPEAHPCRCSLPECAPAAAGNGQLPARGRANWRVWCCRCGAAYGGEC